MGRNGILAGGNFITDFVKVVEEWPEQDTLVSIKSESLSNGGGPYNILKDLAVLCPEIPREACGLIGDDPNGNWIIQDCQRAGIGIEQVHRTSDAATSYTDAMTVESTGRRTFFHQRGANAMLSPEHFDFEQTNAKLFFLGYLMLLDQLDQVDSNGQTGASMVLQRARQAGLVTAVDCVSAPGKKFPQVVLAALSATDILFLNEFELGQVIDQRVEPDRDSLVEAVQVLNGMVAHQSTIVVHSALGAAACRDGNIWVQGSVDFPEEKIAGANGAGDAFAAGFLLGVHQSCAVETSLQYGVCVAAQSLTDTTTSGGLRSLEECLGLGEQWEFRDF